MAANTAAVVRTSTGAATAAVGTDGVADGMAREAGQVPAAAPFRAAISPASRGERHGRGHRARVGRGGRCSFHGGCRQGGALLFPSDAARYLRMNVHDRSGREGRGLRVKMRPVGTLNKNVRGWIISVRGADQGC